jgi:hypothetical protein
MEDTGDPLEGRYSSNRLLDLLHFFVVSLIPNFFTLFESNKITFLQKQLKISLVSVEGSDCMSGTYYGFYYTHLFHLNHKQKLLVFLSFSFLC